MSAGYYFYNAKGKAKNDFERDIADGLYALAKTVENLKSELDCVKSVVRRG